MCLIGHRCVEQGRRKDRIHKARARASAMGTDCRSAVRTVDILKHRFPPKTFLDYIIINIFLDEQMDTVDCVGGEVRKNETC